MLKYKFYLFLIIDLTVINFAIAKDVALQNYTRKAETNRTEWRSGRKAFPEERTVREEMKTDRQAKKFSKEKITKLNKKESEDASANKVDEMKKDLFSTKTHSENHKNPLFYESEQENTRGEPDTSASRMDTEGHDEIKQKVSIEANNVTLPKLHDDDLTSSSESSEDKSEYLQTRRYAIKNDLNDTPLLHPPRVVEPLFGNHLTNAALYNAPQINSGLYNSPSDPYRNMKTYKSGETYISGNGLHRNEYPYSPTYFEQISNWPDNAFNAHNRNMQYFDQVQGKRALYQDIPRRNIADIAALSNPFLRYYSHQV